jgi:peptide chain release factor subunit 1
LYEEDRELRDNFRKALREARAYLEDDKNDLSNQGVAIIADPSQNLFHTYDMPRPVGNEIVLDTSPYIRPLAQLKDDWEPFALAMLDNGRAHCYLVYLSQIKDETSVKGEVLSHQKNGGWSQARYSRRRANKQRGFFKEVARELGALLRKEKVNRIILAGSAEAKHKLVDHLPQDLQRKVVGFVDVTMDKSANEVLRKSFPVFFAAEAREEKAMIGELRDRLAAGGLAVAGIEETAVAVSSGRAERVLVTDGHKPEGWKCERCDVMEEGEAGECILCGEKVYPVDLVEEIVEYAQKTAAEVIFVSRDSPVLVELGSIGATLRF